MVLPIRKYGFAYSLICPSLSSHSYVNIPNALATLRLQTVAHADDGGAVHEYELNTDVHSVLEPGLGMRQLFGFDGFMNHSCDPTTYSANNVEGRRGGRYDTVARRDIAAGEQVWFGVYLMRFICSICCERFALRKRMREHSMYVSLYKLALAADPCLFSWSVITRAPMRALRRSRATMTCSSGTARARRSRRAAAVLRSVARAFAVLPFSTRPRSGAHCSSRAIRCWMSGTARIRRCARVFTHTHTHSRNIALLESA
jgi:hypothetical protein